MITYTPAVLVTGSDNRGNEFCFWKSLNGWMDGYNECFVDPDLIRKHVFPIVQKVYFSDLIMTGTEWVAAGCPMELTDEQMRLIQDEHPANIAQDMEREMDGAEPSPIISGGEWDWDFTPFPKDMPDINFDAIDEIPF